MQQYLGIFTKESCFSNYDDFATLVTQVGVTHKLNLLCLLHITLYTLQMSLTIAGTKLLQNSSEIYSLTERPVINIPPPTNEVLITTISSNSSQSQDMAQELWTQLERLNVKFGCDFIDLVRFGRSQIILVQTPVSYHAMLIAIQMVAQKQSLYLTLNLTQL